MVHLFVLLAAFTQSDCCLLCSCLLRPYSSSIILAFLFYAFEFFFFFLLKGLEGQIFLKNNSQGIHSVFRYKIDTASSC